MTVSGGTDGGAGFDLGTGDAGPTTDGAGPLPDVPGIDGGPVTTDSGTDGGPGVDGGPTCASACGMGNVCDTSLTPPVCVANGPVRVRVVNLLTGSRKVRVDLGMVNGMLIAPLDVGQAFMIAPGPTQAKVLDESNATLVDQPVQIYPGVLNTVFVMGRPAGTPDVSARVLVVPERFPPIPAGRIRLQYVNGVVDAPSPIISVSRMGIMGMTVDRFDASPLFGFEVDSMEMSPFFFSFKVGGMDKSRLWPPDGPGMGFTPEGGILAAFAGGFDAPNNEAGALSGVLIAPPDASGVSPTLKLMPDSELWGVHAAPDATNTPFFLCNQARNTSVMVMGRAVSTASLRVGIRERVSFSTDPGCQNNFYDLGDTFGTSERYLAIATGILGNAATPRVAFTSRISNMPTSGMGSLVRGIHAAPSKSTVSVSLSYYDTTMNAYVIPNELIGFGYGMAGSAFDGALIPRAGTFNIGVHPPATPVPTIGYTMTGINLPSNTRIALVLIDEGSGPSPRSMLMRINQAPSGMFMSNLTLLQ